MTELLYAVLPRNTSSPETLKYRRRVNASDRTAGLATSEVEDEEHRALDESDFDLLLKTRQERRHRIDTTA